MAYRARRTIWAAVAPAGRPVRAPRSGGRPSAFSATSLELVTPSQWDGGGRSLLQPAERLMLAILTDAINLVLQEPAPMAMRRALVRRKAARWIRANDTKWLFSFVNICETLGIDAGRLRAKVARLAERGGHPG
jgi:hypothetical protein